MVTNFTIGSTPLPNYKRNAELIRTETRCRARLARPVWWGGPWTERGSVRGHASWVLAFVLSEDVAEDANVDPVVPGQRQAPQGRLQRRPDRRADNAALTTLLKPKYVYFMPAHQTVETRACCV